MSPSSTVACIGGKPLLEGEQEKPRELTVVLKNVVQLAGSTTAISDAKLEQALELLSSVEPAVARLWFKDWLTTASVKPQAALLFLLQRVISRSLEGGITIAERLVARESTGVGDVASVGQVTSLCKEALSISAEKRSAVLLAMQVLSDSSMREPTRSRTDAEIANAIVPSLDRFVLLLRPSLLAHIESSAENLQHWRSFVSDAGLPPLEQHLTLLSCSAKAVVLSLVLVLEETPPLVVVANREAPLLHAGAGRVLPKEHACVLLPYFESASGTKIVQGTRVEGGEGHGPRKEFFIAATSAAIKKWSSVAIPTPRGSPSSSPPSDIQVSFAGNRVVVEKTLVSSGASSSSSSRAHRMVSRAVAQGCVGDRLRLEFSNDTEVMTIITATHGETSVSTSEGLSDLLADAVCGCGLQKPVKPLFEFHRGTGQHWFTAYASDLDNVNYGQELQQRFQVFGKLLLLALVNRCKISILLPVMFFRLLLEDKLNNARPNLEDLKNFDKDLYLSLKKCQKMSAANFKALKEVEMLPESMGREEYVAEKVRETFEPKAMDEIRTGFWSLVRPCISLSGITEGDLRQLLCPIDNLSDKLTVRDIFKVEMEEEMSDHEVFVNAFWSVVDGLPLADKKLFLTFVTGLDSVPEPKTERLLIELPFSAFCKEETLAMLDLLPQAHTCSNTLELPNYYEALKESGQVADGPGSPAFAAALRALLQTKLLVAIRETSGYELDATGQPGAVPESPARQQQGQQPFSPQPFSPQALSPFSPPMVDLSRGPEPVAPMVPTIPTTAAPLPREAELPIRAAPPVIPDFGSLSLESPLANDNFKVSSDIDTFLAELEAGLGGMPVQPRSSEVTPRLASADATHTTLT